MRQFLGCYPLFLREVLGQNPLKRYPGHDLGQMLFMYVAKVIIDQILYRLGESFKNIEEIAKSGVDIISVGALTHSAKAVDVSLEMIPL